MIHIAKPIIGKEEKKAVSDVIDSGIIAYGPKTQEFEKQFSKYVNSKYAIATTSGTTALHLALLSIGIREGDEVIVPSFSFIATANTVLFCNAKPVFCDVNPKTFNIEVDEIRKLITKKTKAIMPVHLYGQPSDMKTILQIGREIGIQIIGDAAQAHGAMYEGKMIGSISDLECFSFYPTKNMTTGEGGMITTNNRDIYNKLLSIRNHGREKTKWGYNHGRIGYNYRMTDIAAAIGCEQLKKLDNFNEKRIENARFFNKNLKGVEIPFVIKKAKHVYHQYTIKCKNRNKLIKEFKKKEIGYGIYYPKPLHHYSHLKPYGHKNLKVSEKLVKEVISIPVNPAVKKEELIKIKDTINGVYLSHGK